MNLSPRQRAAVEQSRRRREQWLELMLDCVLLYVRANPSASRRDLVRYWLALEAAADGAR